MSEMTYSALVILTIFLMGFWQRPFWIYLTCFVIVGSVTIRYIGITLILSAALWTLITQYPLRRPISIKHAFVALALASALIGFLVYTNVMATGYASGGERAAGHFSCSDIIFHAANFGLSWVGAFSGGLAGILGSNLVTQVTIGLTIYTCTLLLALHACLRPQNRWHAPAGVVVLAYTLGIVALRSISVFDDLWSPRFSLPIIAPLFLIVVSGVGNIGRLRRLAVSTVVPALAVISVVRGLSPETFGDVREASWYLSQEAPKSATVYVNSEGISLAAHISNKVSWESPGEISHKLNHGDFLVLAAKRFGRQGERLEFDNSWRAVAQDMIASRKLILKFETDAAQVYLFP